jgi:hypothetical protein
MLKAIIMVGILWMASVASGVECLFVSGPWDVPVAIWQDRWLRYDGSVMGDPIESCNAVEGYYLPADKSYITGGPLVTNRKWKQVGGNNWCWFGNGGSPANTFDVWYFGDPNCVSVPLVYGMAIPRLPTFLPNQPGLGTGNFKPWGRPASNGFPRVELIVVTDVQAANLLNYGVFNFSGEIPDVIPTNPAVIVPPFSVGIRVVDRRVEVFWPSVTGAVYTLWGSLDLSGWLALKNAIPAMPPINVEIVTGKFFRVTSP